jgi:hypothetical protein
VFTLATEMFDQTPMQVFNRLFGTITPSRPAILAAYFLNDTDTPIMSAHAFLWKCKLRVAFLAIKTLRILRAGIALLV